MLEACLMAARMPYALHHACMVCPLPYLAAVAMEPGLRFAIREGGRTVGAGVVGEIIE